MAEEVEDLPTATNPRPPPPGNEPPSDVDSRRRTRQGHPRPLGRRQLRSHAHLGRRYDEHCPGKKTGRSRTTHLSGYANVSIDRVIRRRC